MPLSKGAAALATAASILHAPLSGRRATTPAASAAAPACALALALSRSWPAGFGTVFAVFAAIGTFAPLTLARPFTRIVVGLAFRAVGFVLARAFAIFV
jgi:hypothetical protein